MLDYNVKIGLVPLRRDCTPRPGMFNWEYAEERGRKTVAYIEEHFTNEHVSFVDLKGVIDVEVLWSLNDVDKVAEHFRKNGVDAIFLIPAKFLTAQTTLVKLSKPFLSISSSTGQFSIYVKGTFILISWRLIAKIPHCVSVILSPSG